MKRNDPYTRIQRQQLSTLSITIPLLTLFALFEAFNPRTDLFIKVGFPVLWVIVLILAVFAIFRYRSNLKRLDQRRERARQGDRSLLAREQPLPDPHILPFPRLLSSISHDAPLFSCMRFYELSNEHTVVRWANMPTRALLQRRENMAHAEYRRNVQELLSFIVARTGLPLYDLSPSSGAN